MRRSRTVMVAVSALVALLLVSCGGTRGRSTAPAASMTLEYAPGFTQSVYLPPSPGRVPLVVLVPGGSWRTADPTGLLGLAAALAKSGIATAAARIRAADDGVLHPVPVEDVLCAVAAAVEGVRSRGYAPGPVAVLGHSSGAHLAALAVLAVDEYAPDCGSPVVRPDALIGLSGPYDIGQVPELAQALLGSSPADDPDTWASANPVGRADLRPEVPVLLLHGTYDEDVAVTATVRFADALTRAGHPTSVQILPKVDHQSIYLAGVAAERVARWVLALRPAVTATG